jgi:hypothetical protein
MNLSTTITPKSDQLNADDLLSGPRTIRITDVQAGASPEQPVNIHFDGDNGRPYKPGKSMRRVLVSMWGADSKAYIDKRITLYNDPTITFGPEKTGGIRISHASGIDAPLEIALTVKKGKRRPHTVQPLPDFTAALEAIKTAAATGADALKAAFLALPKDIQDILRTDATNLKPKA